LSFKKGTERGVIFLVDWAEIILYFFILEMKKIKDTSFITVLKKYKLSTAVNSIL